MPEILSSSPSPTQANLGNAPPQPSLQAAKPQGSLMTSGMGADAASPQAMAIQGMAMIEQGAKLLGAVLPGASAATADMIAQLRMAVAQQISQMAPMGASGLPSGMPGMPVMPTGGPTGPPMGM